MLTLVCMSGCKINYSLPVNANVGYYVFMRKNEGNEPNRRRKDLLLGLGLGSAGVASFLTGVFGITAIAGAEETPPANDITVDCTQPVNPIGHNLSFADLQAHAGKTIMIEGKGVGADGPWVDTVGVTVSRDSLEIDGVTYDPEALHHSESVKVHPEGFVGNIALMSEDGEQRVGIAYACPVVER